MKTKLSELNSDRDHGINKLDYKFINFIIVGLEDFLVEFCLVVYGIPQYIN